ncbi:ABC transporter ATP-binding protein [Sneathia vaginalis]|uniref:ABC transporter ATP-binding protein n=1 Tax=Sneathia vaginalis TaxID=187101 RepID=UPI00288A15CB|nr:ABC transporter ATP-binding protein [Sneathia vaginalis]
MIKYIMKNKKYLLISVLFYFLSSVFNILVSYSMGFFTNASLKKELNIVIIWALITLISIVISNFFQGITIFFRGRFSSYAILNLKNEIYKKILKIENNKDVDNYFSIINADIEILKKDYFEGIVLFISIIIKIVMSCIAILALNFEIFILFIIITIPTTFFLPFLKKKLSLKKSKMSKNNFLFTKELKNYLFGNDVIIQFDKRNNFILRLLKIDKDFELSKEENKNWDSNVSLFSTTLVMVSQMFCMIIGAYYIYLGKIEIGTMITTTQLLNYIVLPISSLNSNFVKIKSTKKIIEKIDNIFKINELNNLENIDGDIEFKNFSVKFDNKILYKNFNYSFKKRNRYLIRGASGTGKTILIKSLLKRNNNYYGEIFINNKNIKDLSQKNILDKIIYVSQNDYIFDVGVSENIKLFDDFEVSEIIKELEIKTNINDIVELSGGEKQKINLARAFIREADVYIFDEPTNFLDYKSKQKVIDKIFSLKNKIILVISHDTDRSFIDKFDHIIELGDIN